MQAADATPQATEVELNPEGPCSGTEADEVRLQTSSDVLCMIAQDALGNLVINHVHIFLAHACLLTRDKPTPPYSCCIASTLVFVLYRKSHDPMHLSDLAFLLHDPL